MVKKNGLINSQVSYFFSFKINLLIFQNLHKFFQFLKCFWKQIKEKNVKNVGIRNSLL